MRRALPRLSKLYAKTVRRDARVKEAPSPRHVSLAEEFVITAAFHEAGHVVALWHCLGEVPEFVTIEKASELLAGPTWGFLRRQGGMDPETERSLFLKAPPGLQQAIKKEKEVMVDLAGPAVDASRAPEAELSDASDRLEESNVEGGDTAHALEKLSVVQENEDLRWRWLHRLHLRTERLIRRPKISDAVGKVAEALYPEVWNEPDDRWSLLVQITATSHGESLVPGRKLEVVVSQGPKELGRKSLALEGGSVSGRRRFALQFGAKWESCVPIKVEVSIVGHLRQHRGPRARGAREARSLAEYDKLEAQCRSPWQARAISR